MNPLSSSLFYLLFVYFPSSVSSFGCFWFNIFDQLQFFPLRSVVINATVIDGIAEVQVTHEFETTHPLFDGSQEVTYELPIDEQGAVTSFRAFIEDRVIEGIVKEKEEARQDYDQAVADGNPAFLAESASPEVFKLSIGNVPLQQVFRVELVYIAPVKTVSSNHLQFVLPASLAPEVEPPVVFPGVPVIVFNNAGVTIHLRAILPNIQNITSDTHTIQVTSASANEIVSNFEDPEFVDRRDIVFDITVDDSSSTTTTTSSTLQVFAETTPTTSAMMMTIIPEIQPDSITFTQREYIFVIDRSSTMGDNDKIDLVGSALAEVLGQLEPTGIYNILSFGGTTAEFFQDASISASDDGALTQAVLFALTMNANLGTERNLLAAFEELIAFPTTSGFERSVFVITDGQEGEEYQQVLDYVGLNQAGMQVFALGVGEGVSRVLINGLARNGRGTSEIVFGESEGLDSTKIYNALVDQIEVASAPTLNVQFIDWGNGNGSQAPFITPPLFSGKRFTLYYLRDTSAVLPAQIQLTGAFVGVGDADTVTYQVDEEDYFQADGFVETTVIHKMAARELIRGLEEDASALHFQSGGAATEEEIKQEIARIGVAYQIASTETSFVAIDNQNWTSVSETSVDTSEDDTTPVAAPVETIPIAAGFCFPAEATVQVLKKGSVPMSELEIGDLVLTGEDGAYSKVYSFGHRHGLTTAPFLQIGIEKPSAPLVISSSHMLYVERDGGSQVTATSAEIKVGDMLVLANGERTKVTRIDTVLRRGLFAPLTEDGSLVVDGFLVSSYASLQHDSSALMIGGYSTSLSMHTLSHAFTAPHRMMCKMCWGWCENETYTAEGLSNFVDKPHQLAHWYLRQSVPLMATLMLFVIVPVALAFVVAECLFAALVQFSFSSSSSVWIVGLTVGFSHLIGRKQSNKAVW